MFLTGYAFQCGHIPISAESILKAIGINGVAVEMNRQAFQLGRLAAADEEQFSALAGLKAKDGGDAEDLSLDTLIDRRAAFLSDYQDAAYARNYRAFVDEVRKAEGAHVPGQSRLTEAVARYLFKLMAYKDEYEVARLYSQSMFWHKLAAEFEGDYRVEFNFAPPLVARRDPETGHLKKRSFGQRTRYLLKLLSKGRKLRGTAFDIFGYTTERKQERQLVEDYRAIIRTLVSRLTPENHDLALEIASLPEHIRGYGHVKEDNIEIAEKRRADLMEQFSAAC